MKTLGRLLLWAIGLYLAGLVLVMAGRGLIGLGHRSEHGARAEDDVLPDHAPVVYYVSPDGDDGASGTAPETAFQTLDAVNALDLGPGDHVRLRAGASFQGSLRFNSDDVGTPLRPIRVESYGEGRAVIDARTGTAIQVTNTGGVEIADLVLQGDGADVNDGDGVLVENRLLGATRLAHIRIEQVEASGFGSFGVRVVAGPESTLGARLDWLLPPKSGYEDVWIEQVTAHSNGLGGITVRGEFNYRWGGTYAHRNVYVGHCQTYRNVGVTGRNRRHSGSGIVVSDVDGAVIERSVAYENGLRSESAAGGPVGIWAWDATDVVIRHNVAYRNRTSGPFDGGGFDLDGGMTHSVMEYNLSYDNDGSGFLLAQFRGAHPFHDNVVRYNVSIGDGRKNTTAGIQLWSGEPGSPITRTEIVHNTIVQTPSETGTPAALRMRAESLDGLIVRDNVFVASGAVLLVSHERGQRGLDLHRNVWGADSLQLEWNGEPATLASWRSALGDNGLAIWDLDSLRLSGPFGADSLGAYIPLDGSPLVDAAQEAVAEVDIRGTPIPQGSAPDVGAIERVEDGQ